MWLWSQQEAATAHLSLVPFWVKAFCIYHFFSFISFFQDLINVKHILKLEVVVSFLDSWINIYLKHSVCWSFTFCKIVILWKLGLWNKSIQLDFKKCWHCYLRVFPLAWESCSIRKSISTVQLLHLNECVLALRLISLRCSDEFPFPKTVIVSEENGCDDAVSNSCRCSTKCHRKCNRA